MLRNTRHSIIKSYKPGLLVLLTSLILIPLTAAVARAQMGKPDLEETWEKAEPIYRAYKGVTIGMTTQEVRQKLGTPKDSAMGQDFYTFSDKEVAQVFYDAAQKVTAVSVNYIGQTAEAPDCKAVFGVTLMHASDGSVRKLIRYPKAGFWVTYSNSGGDDPVVTVTIQKMRQ